MIFSYITKTFSAICKAIAFLCVCTSLGHTQSGDYKISPGDTISVQVYGEDDLSISPVPIPDNGIINFPFLGKVQAAGKSEAELANEISNGLKEGFLFDPQVIVTMIKYRPIYVGGAVSEPGHKAFFINMDVEKLIEISGGLTENADRSSLTLIREDESGKHEIHANLKSELQPGDTITIGRLPGEEIVDTKHYMYLYGEVRRPGRYEFSTGLSVEKAIVIAGGFGNRASKRKISVTRGTPAVKKKKVPLDYAVMPGDIITVGASLF